ncbi:unnamed protein product [Gongylonema pulchrum]|uniref:SCP domain-containing protein n=1 Tax=Gongylonema pulchrum TaxID=637853 RepID=A0A183CWT8_9BILA|nr:unnamed protein product [Gongylonema pulchrum]
MYIALRILLLLFMQLSLQGQGWGKQPDRSNMLGAQYYDGKKIVLPVSEDAMRDLLNHWLHQATGSFMSAFASNKINNFWLNKPFQFN